MHETPYKPESTGPMNVIAALLEQRTGQQIAANRAWRIETALKPVLRLKGLDSLDALATQLITTRDPRLSEAVVDALLNQETSFFRDAAVLDQIHDAAVALHADQPGQRLRVWCAGCSTGQEPLSMAMLFDERAAASGMAMPEIVATDVSASTVARCRTGKYSQFEVQRGLSVHRMMKWFDGDDTEWTANSTLVQRIQYRQQNLVVDAPPPGKFDLVMCRNVLLYFSGTLRNQVFETLAKAVRPGGLLALGAGETVIGQTELFEPSSRFRGFYHPATGEGRRAAIR